MYKNFDKELYKHCLTNKDSSHHEVFSKQGYLNAVG